MTEILMNETFVHVAVWIIAAAIAIILFFGTRATIKDMSEEKDHIPEKNWTVTDLKKIAAHMDNSTPGGMK